MEQLYRKFPLNKDKKEIRLFTVFPEPWYFDVRGTFSIVSLDQDPNFIALSYAWGDSASMATVVVEGQLVAVSQNLHSALRRLRWHAFSEEEPRSLTIWADALCIFQADIKEKEYQVPLMRKIYSQCEFTVVWLGEILVLDDKEYEELGSKISPKLFRASSIENPSGSVLACERIIHEICHGRHITAIEPFDRNDEDSSLISIRKVFRILSSNLWHKRRWVVQEAVLAPLVKFYFGEISVGLKTLHKAIFALAEHDDKRCCPSSRPGHVRLRLAIRSFLERFIHVCDRRNLRHEQAHIFDLCRDFADREASLEVDYVYSLLGLTNPPSGVIPDYTIPLHSLLTYLSAQYIKETHSLSHLLFAGISNGREGMPSWAVDWTKADDIWSSFSNPLTDLFHPTIGQPQLLDVQLFPMLRITTSLIDEVEEVASNTMSSQTIREAVKSFGVYLMLHERFNSTYPTGGSWKEAWLRTLSADCCWGPNLPRRLTPEDISFLFDIYSNDTGDRLGRDHLVQLADREQVAADAHFDSIMRLTVSVHYERYLFYTSRGYIGLAKQGVKSGDRVYLVRISSEHTPLRLSPEFVNRDLQT